MTKRGLTVRIVYQWYFVVWPYWILHPPELVRRPHTASHLLPLQQELEVDDHFSSVIFTYLFSMPLSFTVCLRQKFARRIDFTGRVFSPSSCLTIYGYYFFFFFGHVGS